MMKQNHHRIDDICIDINHETKFTPTKAIFARDFFLRDINSMNVNN